MLVLRRNEWTHSNPELESLCSVSTETPAPIPESNECCQKNFFQFRLNLQAKLCSSQICWDLFHPFLSDCTWISHIAPASSVVNVLSTCYFLWETRGGCEDSDVKETQVHRQLTVLLFRLLGIQESLSIFRAPRGQTSTTVDNEAVNILRRESWAARSKHMCSYSTQLYWVPWRSMYTVGEVHLHRRKERGCRKRNRENGLTEFLISSFPIRLVGNKQSRKYATVSFVLTARQTQSIPVIWPLSAISDSNFQAPFTKHLR